MSEEIDRLVAGAIADGRTRLARTTGIPADLRAIGVGWATVELERAERAAGLGFGSVAPDDALGATCRRAERADGVALVLLEPATEGPLSAWLARFGEGPVAVWFEALSAPGRAGLDPPVVVTRGPFGPERLVAGTARAGRFVFVVDTAGDGGGGSAP